MKTKIMIAMVALTMVGCSKYIEIEPIPDNPNKVVSPQPTITVTMPNVSVIVEGDSIDNSNAAEGGSSSATGGSNSNDISSGNNSATGGSGNGGTGGSASAGNSTSTANNTSSSNSTNNSTNSGSASNQANNSTNNNSTNGNSSNSSSETNSSNENTSVNNNALVNTVQASCNSGGCACSCPETNSPTPCNSECGKPDEIEEVNGSTVQALMAGSLQVGTITTLKLNSSQVRLTFSITSDRHCLSAVYGYASNAYPSSQAVSVHNLVKTNLGCKITETLIGSVDTTKNMFVSALADVFTTTFATSSYVSYQATAGSLTGSYITVNVTSNAGSATAPGYCFDKNTFITLGTTYQNCKLMSTLRSDLPVVHPENVELVNYIMNKDYSYLGTVSAQDKQDAIWKLLQDVATTNAKALNIIADAILNGQGFVPAMNQKVGLLVWCGATIQPNAGFFTMSDLFLGSGLVKMIGNTNFCQSGSYQAIKFL